MGFSPIIKSWLTSQAEPDSSFHTSHTSIKVMIPARVRRDTDRHEIFKFGNSFGEQKPCNQDIGRRPIKLLMGHLRCNWGNLKTTALLVIQDCTKDTGGIKVRE